MTLSSNDIYGPKGVGALYIRRGKGINPILIGGGQERGLRSGSENVPGIVGMSAAAEIMQVEMPGEVERMTNFRDSLIEQVLAEIPQSHLNGLSIERLANNAHFRFAGIEGESMLLSFKDYDMAISTGSDARQRPSNPPTLLATGSDPRRGQSDPLKSRQVGGRRKTDINKVVEVLPGIVDRLRKLSPIYKCEGDEE